MHIIMFVSISWLTNSVRALKITLGQFQQAEYMQITTPRLLM